MPRLLAATAALAALTVVGAGASATASDSQKAHAAVIKMKQDGKDLFFEGPESVAAGDVLKIKNVDRSREGRSAYVLARPQEGHPDGAVGHQGLRQEVRRDLRSHHRVARGRPRDR